jgi:hypothetical protein
MAFFDSISWVYTSLLFVVPSILASLLVLRWVRKKFSVSALRKHHDVAGYTFSIVGVLYSVILGFTVINVENRYNEAEETVRTEAMMVDDLFRDAVYFDEMSRSAIRASLRSYVNYVIKEEWALLPKKLWLYRGSAILENLWKSYETVDLTSVKSKIWYEQTIRKLDKLMDARLSREFYSAEHLGSMMWTILILGAIITLSFMFLFGLENLRIQMLMTALLSGYLSFILYLVFSLDHIFQGSPQIQPKAFEEILVLFDKLDQDNFPE